MGTMFGQRWRGRRERDVYDDTAVMGAHLNAMSPGLRAQGGGEQLATMYRDKELWEGLQQDTYDARSQYAQEAIRNVQAEAARRAADLMGGYQGGEVPYGALEGIAADQAAAMNRIGNRAMMPFRQPTMANARRSWDFGARMSQMYNAGADQIGRWVDRALGIERAERQDAMDAARLNYTMGRDQQRDWLDAQKLGYDMTRGDIELDQKQQQIDQQGDYRDWLNTMAEERLGLQEQGLKLREEQMNQRSSMADERNQLSMMRDLLRSGGITQQDAVDWLNTGEVPESARATLSDYLGGGSSGSRSRRTSTTGKGNVDYFRRRAELMGYQLPKKGLNDTGETDNAFMGAFERALMQYGGNENAAIDSAMAFVDENAFMIGMANQLGIDPNSVYDKKTGKMNDLGNQLITSIRAKQDSAVPVREHMTYLLSKTIPESQWSPQLKQAVNALRTQPGLGEQRPMAKPQQEFNIPQTPIQQPATEEFLPETITPSRIGRMSMSTPLGTQTQEQAWSAEGQRLNTRGRPVDREGRTIIKPYEYHTPAWEQPSATGQMFDAEGYPIDQFGNRITDWLRPQLAR